MSIEIAYVNSKNIYEEFENNPCSLKRIMGIVTRQGTRKISSCPLKSDLKYFKEKGDKQAHIQNHLGPIESPQSNLI